MYYHFWYFFVGCFKYDSPGAGHPKVTRWWPSWFSSSHGLYGACIELVHGDVFQTNLELEDKTGM